MTQLLGGLASGSNDGDCIIRSVYKPYELAARSASGAERSADDAVIPIRFSLKMLLLSVAVAAVLCAAVGWILNARAHDAWGYGKLAISSGTGRGPVYYVEVRGVGEQPTVARILRFANPADAPRNALEVSQRVAAELAAHVRNGNRWDKSITIIAGRTNDEQIVIEVDAATARKLFARPGMQLESLWYCDAMWDKYVAKHMPPER